MNLVGIHKTAAGSMHSRTVALPAAGDLGCPVSRIKALHGAHGRLFADKAPYAVPVLRARKVSSHGKVRQPHVAPTQSARASKRPKASCGSPP
jgi:hypothetical protein